MEKQFIKDLKNGEFVKSFFSVKYKHPPKDYKNGYMFTLGLADKTGEIELTYFGGTDKQKVDEIYNGIKEGDVIFTKGYANDYKGKLKISVNKGPENIRKAKPEEYNLDMFIPVTNQNVEKMFSEIKSKIDSITNVHLRKLLSKFFEDSQFVAAFKKAPAAMYKHHACMGGLLEHVWGVVRLCETEAEIHPSLDRDLLLTGAILHDIGKIKEFIVTTNIKQSEEGMLLGHVLIGEQMILEKINTIDGFPEMLKNKLLHIIISHHGKKEYGASIEPAIPEAVVVFLADMLDSQVTQYIRAKKDANTEDFRTYNKSLGSIYLK